MNKLKEAIKTPLGVTILVTVVVVILLIVLTIIKDTFLGGETIDYSILFLTLVPFLIYLAVTGKISEIGGGGFGIKFNKASEAKVFFKLEKVAYVNQEVIKKEGLGFLRDRILPEIEAKPRSTLELKRPHYYNYEILKVYLKELTKFDFFRYVIFVGENDAFNGYIDARSLLTQLVKEFLFSTDVALDEDLNNGMNSEDLRNMFKNKGFSLSRDAIVTGERKNGWVIADKEKFFVIKEEVGKLNVYKDTKIIEDINEWNLDKIKVKKYYIKDYQSNRETLRIMEEEGITDIAVVDKYMKFIGFTNREMIISRIVNNLMSEAE